MIEITTSKQWGWCGTCGKLVVRTSHAKPWQHNSSVADEHCGDLIPTPLQTATGSDRDMTVQK